MKQDSFYIFPLDVLRLELPREIAGRHKLTPNACLAYAVIYGTECSFKMPYCKGLAALADEIGMGKGRDERTAILQQLESSGLVEVDRTYRQGHSLRITATERDDIRGKPFLKAYKLILNRKDLKPNAKTVWFYINGFTETNGAFSGNIKQLCEVLNISRNTAGRMLSDLRKKALARDVKNGIMAIFPPSPKTDDLSPKPDTPCTKNGTFNKISYKDSNKILCQSIVLNQGDKGGTEGQTRATAPPGTPKKTEENSDLMSAPPKHSADESVSPTRESEERPTAPIIPDLTLKTREEREISAIDQILADGFNGFWPRLTEYQTWFDFWEERKWINMDHPDYFMDFRTHHLEQIRRDMPKDEGFRRKWRETEPQRREHNKPEFEAKLHQLKERITAP